VLRLTANGSTHPGPRPANEDAHFVDLSLGLLVVADGMGGHNAGEIASRLAIDTVVRFIQQTHGQRNIAWPLSIEPGGSLAGQRLNVALRLANQRVHDEASRQADQSGMGTTIVAALIDDDRLVIGHVGDSRAYVLRAGTLQQLTEDHTWVNAVMGANHPDAKGHPYRHVLTNGIGLAAELTPVLLEDRLQVGERWLLCTDGVHGAVDGGVLQRLLTTEPLDAAADAIVQRALGDHTTDNATAIVLNVG